MIIISVKMIEQSQFLLFSLHTVLHLDKAFLGINPKFCQNLWKWHLVTLNRNKIVEGIC